MLTRQRNPQFKTTFAIRWLHWPGFLTIQKTEGCPQTVVMVGGATAPEEIALVKWLHSWLQGIGCNFLIYFPHCSLCPLRIGPLTFVEGEKPKFSTTLLSKGICDINTSCCLDRSLSILHKRYLSVLYIKRISKHHFGFKTTAKIATEKPQSACQYFKPRTISPSYHNSMTAT